MSKIASLNMRNFKCFRDEEIDFGDLTILTGLNGMGKSSVIQALLLLRQSFGTSRFSGRRLKINGDLIELGAGSDVFFDLAEEDELSIGYDYIGSGGTLFRREYRYAYDRSAESLKPIVSGGHAYNYTIFFWSDDKSDWLEIVDSDMSREAILDSPAIYSQSRFQYLSAERLGPRKLLASSEEHARFGQLGSQGEYVLSLLSAEKEISLSESDPRMHDESDATSLRMQVEAWLQEISPGTRMEINSFSEIDAHTSRFSFERRGDVPSRPFRSTNVGFGISYVLPVLVALLSARAGSIVVIENPEAHLHPRGQTRMGILAAKAAKAGVQVVIETHSDHFLDGVRIAAKENICEAADVAIHYFTRFGTEAAVISPQLLEDGRLSEWPEGFFDERDDNLAKLLTPTSGK